MTGQVERSKAKSPKAAGQRIAVIDIGSNSVRLVVFDQLSRAPIPLFNEKVFAALGKTVGETGKLNPLGVEQAFSTLTRFSLLLKAMHVGSCHVVATAAVRDATDGPDFAGAIEWLVTPHAIPHWRATPVIQVSQIGYHPKQPKVAVIELDRAEDQVEPVASATREQPVSSTAAASMRLSRKISTPGSVLSCVTR